MLGFQPKSRSAALEWGTGLLFVIAVIYLIQMIGIIALIQEGREVVFLSVGIFIVFPLTLPAAIYAARRKHWGYVRGVTIWLPIYTIMGESILFVSTGPWAPGVIAYTLFEFLAEITCLILISRTKAEFS
jgi:hypothetical protein